MEKKRPKAKVSKKKISEVKRLKELVNSYPVLGILDMTSMPGFQLLRIKSALRDVVKIRMAKKKMLERVFNELKDEKKGIEKLGNRLQGSPAVIFSKEEPFKLAKLIMKNKSMASAKPGQIAPADLTIPAGLTPFQAGPMIGELGAMGIKTKVEAGKISILEDTVLVKAGNIIDNKRADLLSKLGIEPMEVGLNLILTYKDGEILEKAVLFVSEEEYINNIKLAFNQSLALSLEIGYVNKDNIKVLLGKANREANAIAKKAKITTSENIGEQLAKAEAEAESIKKSLPMIDGVTKEEAKKVEEVMKKVEPKEETLKETIAKKEEIKLKGKADTTKEEMELAKKRLQELVDKKIKGEI